MLNEKVFKHNLTKILLFHDIQINPVKSNMLYELMRDDFEEEEFIEICEDITKYEDLYGRYPTPRMFYSRKNKKPTSKERLEAELELRFSNFFEELCKELSSPISHYDVNKLPRLERKTINAFGGFKSLYEAVNRGVYGVSLLSLRKQMQKFFFDNYSAEQMLGEENLAEKALQNVLKNFKIGNEVNGGRHQLANKKNFLKLSFRKEN